MEKIKDHFLGNIEEFSGIDRKRVPFVDLRDMARQAMNYFLRTPRPNLNYACGFGGPIWNNILLFPSQEPEAEDLIAVGDSDVRLDSTFAALRLLSNIKENKEVEAGVHRRIMSYVGNDNLSTMAYAAVCAGDLSGETRMKSPWTTGWTIRSLTERFLVYGEEPALKKARKMALALKNIASWDTGRAYYPGGLLLNGKWFGGGFGAEVVFYTSLPCDLLYYAETAHDDEIKEFAYALARGIVADLPSEDGPFSMLYRRFRPDGSFSDHTHLHTRTVWSVAMAGRIMQDPALIEWARRAYEFVRSCGTDFGWFPERIILPGEQPHDDYRGRVNISETCITGDMVQTAAELAKAGHIYYWDHVERYVKNYLHEVQFAVTPEVAEFYRKQNAGQPAREVEQGLTMMRKYEGGFLSNVLVNQINSPEFGAFPIAGCCVPEGARAVVTAARSLLEQKNSGVNVNMVFSCDSEDGHIQETEKGVVVAVRKPGTWRLRPPAWTNRGSVKTTRNGKSVPAQWYRDYLSFDGLRKGEKLAVTWHIPSFSQNVEVGGKIGEKYRYTIFWCGNRVTKIVPPGKSFPLFTGTRKK